MNSNKKTARIAGALYLALAISGIFSLMYVPSTLLWMDEATTLEKIIATQSLYRFSIISDVLMYTSFMLLVLVLYKLLKPVNKNMAVLMVVFVMISLPISFLNIANKFTVLNLIKGADYLSIFSPQELLTQIKFYLDLHYSIDIVANLFWGLWLFPFGFLVYKSGFLPKFFGIFLMIGSFGYLKDFFGFFLFPDFLESTLSTIISIPSAIGEFGICLWLLIMGAKETALPNK